MAFFRSQYRTPGREPALSEPRYGQTYIPVVCEGVCVGGWVWRVGVGVRGGAASGAVCLTRTWAKNRLRKESHQQATNHQALLSTWLIGTMD